MLRLRLLLVLWNAMRSLLLRLLRLLIRLVSMNRARRLWMHFGSLFGQYDWLWRVGVLTELATMCF